MSPKPRPRSALPVAVATLLAFGCATVRAPVSAMDGDVTVGPDGPVPQVELWLESGAPITEAERARAVAEVRGALDRATRALVSDDGETLLVVRAQGISRTASRRANQQAAKVGIAVGAVAAVALVVLAIAGGKGGGGGGGGGFLKGARLPAAPRVPVSVPAPPRFRLPTGRVHAHGPGAVVAVQGDVVVPAPGDAEVREASVVAEVEPGEGEERTAFPPSEAVRLHLPLPRPLDVERRKFFDKDFTRLELLVVDRDTGEPTWIKVVEGTVDPRDAAAVKRLMAKAIEDPGGWERTGPPAP